MSRPKADPVGKPRGSLKPVPVAPVNLARIGAPDPPELLGEVGTEMWNRLWSAGKDVYRLSDQNIVERYCSFVERRHEYLATIAADGWVTVGSMGQVVAHPAAKLLSDTEAKMVGLEDRLGLNPEARLRLGMAEITRETALDRFLAH